MSSLLTKIGIIYTQLLQEEIKDLSNDAPIRVIGPKEPWICTQMLKKLSENSEQNFLPLHLAAPC